MRWMNRLATAVLTLAVVAGPPLFAAAWLFHHPWRPPTSAQLRAWTEQPMTAGTIITGCVMIAVLGWLLLVVHLARLAFTGLTRRARRLRHLPVPTPAQMTATSMASLAALTAPTTPVGHTPLPPAAAAPRHIDEPAGTDHAAFTAEQAQTAGVALPGGGWIPYRTAAAITALAAAGWVQRRRHYRPNPHQPRDHQDDPDLQPDPNTVHTIVSAVTNGTPAGDEPAAPLLPLQQLPDGILQLTGPGAAAAARGILVTAEIGNHTPVWIRPDDLHALQPATDQADPAATNSTEAKRGSNPAGTHGGGPRDADNARSGPPRGHHGEPHVGTLIVLRDDPAATHRWHVTADGTATGTGLTPPRRLCILDPQSATDLLVLIDPRRPPLPVAIPLRATSSTGPADSAYGLATAAVAHLTLLGGCQLTAGGEPVHLRRTAGLQILTYLAVHPDGATGNQLTQALWPHLPPATIINRLHTTLTDLRTQLRPLLGTDPVIRQDDRYRLNTDVINSDLQKWRTAREAIDHALDTTNRQRASRDLVDAYQGELAADRSWPWLTPARERIRRSVIDAYATLAHHAESGQALTWLQQAIAIDPYNETLHQQTAALLEASDDHPGAVELIQALHERLAARRGLPG